MRLMMEVAAATLVVFVASYGTRVLVSLTIRRTARRVLHERLAQMAIDLESESLL